MCMIRCPDNNSINGFFLLFKHDPEIPVPFGIGVKLIRFSSPFIIHITKESYVFAIAVLDIMFAYPARTYGSNI